MAGGDYMFHILLERGKAFKLENASEGKLLQTLVKLETGEDLKYSKTVEV